jgi:hypothetical protein
MLRCPACQLIDGDMMARGYCKHCGVDPTTVQPARKVRRTGLAGAEPAPVKVEDRALIRIIGLCLMLAAVCLYVIFAGVTTTLFWVSVVVSALVAVLGLVLLVLGRLPAVRHGQSSRPT